MKTLALSDVVLEKIYSPDLGERYPHIELVVGCGDLPYYYLEHVVSLLPVRVLYVHGNHDKIQYKSNGMPITEAHGCELVDGEVSRIGNFLVAGLGGSIRYRPNAKYQYTEFEMFWRIVRLVPRLLWNRLRYGRFLDVLLTHSPPFGIHDGTDLAHTGFKVFLMFMRLFKPKYLLHGHKHIYRQDETRVTKYRETTVINVYPSREIDLGS